MGKYLPSIVVGALGFVAGAVILDKLKKAGVVGT